MLVDGDKCMTVADDCRASPFFLFPFPFIIIFYVNMRNA